MKCFRCLYSAEDVFHSLYQNESGALVDLNNIACRFEKEFSEVFPRVEDHLKELKKEVPHKTDDTVHPFAVGTFMGNSTFHTILDNLRKDVADVGVPGVDRTMVAEVSNLEFLDQFLVLEQVASKISDEKAKRYLRLRWTNRRSGSYAIYRDLLMTCMSFQFETDHQTAFEREIARDAIFWQTRDDQGFLEISSPAKSFPPKGIDPITPTQDHKKAPSSFLSSAEMVIYDKQRTGDGLRAAEVSQFERCQIRDGLSAAEVSQFNLKDCDLAKDEELRFGVSPGSAETRRASAVVEQANTLFESGKPIQSPSISVPVLESDGKDDNAGFAAGDLYPAQHTLAALSKVASPSHVEWLARSMSKKKPRPSGPFTSDSECPTVSPKDLRVADRKTTSKAKAKSSIKINKNKGLYHKNSIKPNKAKHPIKPKINKQSQQNKNKSFAKSSSSSSKHK